MYWGVTKAFALGALLQSAAAAPKSYKVAKTTEHKGQVIDWIYPESQGKIATPPPHTPLSARSVDDERIKPAQFDFPTPGPQGTVPILRAGGPMPPKGSALLGSRTLSARQDAGKHWYASTNQYTTNHGSTGQINIYDPYVQQDDNFSLLQVAVVNSNAPNKGEQTAEAGWIHYPDLQNQTSAPFLFTFYTTNGYSSDGDNIGGWNRLQEGWVQVASDIYPGISFSPTSSIGGSQYEFTLEYELYDGNWWLYVLNEWIGYYPASLYSAGSTAADSLADHGDIVLWFGEIYNSENDETTTDMGSGEFASAGFGSAAYIRNIQLYDTNNDASDYNPSPGVISDTSRYTLDSHWNSGTNWGSYMYLGGPGAGGVVGG